jgi:hypothetical protein
VGVDLTSRTDTPNAGVVLGFIGAPKAGVSLMLCLVKLSSHAHVFVVVLIVKVLALVALAHPICISDTLKSHLHPYYTCARTTIVHALCLTSNKTLFATFSLVKNLRFEVPTRSILCIPQNLPLTQLEHVICVFGWC